MSTDSEKTEAKPVRRPAQVNMGTGKLKLLIGPVPRMVGTLFSLSTEMVDAARDLACDIVEVRLDQMMRQKDWLERCRKIQAAGMPVILTVRHKSEGGKWNRPESERLKLYAEAIKHLAAVDVEFKSSIAPAVAKLARQNRKVCILSHHNFKGMTPLDEIRSVVASAGKIGSIVKIVTLVESRRGVSRLRELVNEGARVPLCVMGMGFWGESTRVLFPALGSCLTYGYLDVPAAPGQPFAPNLVKQLRQTIPQYDKEFTSRKLRLQVTESEMSLFL